MLALHRFTPSFLCLCLRRTCKPAFTVVSRSMFVSLIAFDALSRPLQTFIIKKILDSMVKYEVTL